MTKERLEKFREIETALRHIRQNIKNERARIERHIAEETTSVRGSRHEIPYDVIDIPVTGAGHKDKKKREEYLNNLRDKEEQLQGELLELEEWLEDVESVEMQDILRLTYRNRMTREQVAAELGYSERTIIRKLKEFWKMEEK